MFTFLIPCSLFVIRYFNNWPSLNDIARLGKTHHKATQESAQCHE